MTLKTLRIDDQAYPEYLRQIASAPKQLYYLGNLLPLLTRPRLAIVGSRRISPYGMAVTKKLAQQAAEQGIVIVSGLALGVDGVAHQGALDANGATFAVLASGLDTIGPATNRHIAESILRRGGALVSEHPYGVLPNKGSFVARNRIVSGISDGVLITEAATKSGTIHTANFALEQGRSVMAVPGNITNLLSEGTNQLIRSGATPVLGVDDILQALNLDLTHSSRPPVAADKYEAAILKHMLQGISDASELMALSGLTPAIFNQTLTMLEITGKIRPLGAGNWATT